MRAGPGVRSSTGRAFAGLVFVVILAGCGGSAASPSPSLSPTASPTLAPIPTPLPTPTPTFVATGNMTVPRMYATATLLTNGKVLIAGGATVTPIVDGSEVLASAELYDPTTGRFTPTGSMTTARAGATATLLRDGRVLIAGGIGCRKQPCSIPAGGGDLASAELYDPATGKFSPTGSMSIGRDSATATLLLDGRVFVAAGAPSFATDLYDPITGRFTRGGPVLGAYDTVAAVLLPSGKVLLAGPALNGPTAEEYDAATGKSSPILLNLPPDAVASAQSTGVTELPETVTLLKDGRVLLGIFGRLVVFDPVTGSFSPSGSIGGIADWLEPSTTLLPDGRVLFAGGSTETPTAVNYAGVFDPASGFRRVSSLIAPLDYDTATLLLDGSVLIAGGSSDLETAIASAELFRP